MEFGKEQESIHRYGEVVFVAEFMYTDFSNKKAILKEIKGLQMSDTTIISVDNIGKDIQLQLNEYLISAPCYSLALDESTDIGVQLCAWV